MQDTWVPSRSVSSVHDLLADPLPLPRVRTLEVFCAGLAGRPLEVTLAELRRALLGPVSGESRRRLHVLVSTLYHRAGAPLDLTIELRGDIEAAPTVTFTEEDRHVV
ncbi:hypothetical protein RVR_2807 [Actinacidiphila reveromycinica]|uniref:Uncharacterized protein n=1 Tax=Actinacidiphila reveromycinica TaxID=659352 RepID=A0A7U3UR52_9ACTN|nr:hypothetical protein [Streptomyces sp. SN-593]BBA97180.1 hypothetical protein RVR_2807 [Streptomyces sp. SN-593]